MLRQIFRAHKLQAVPTINNTLSGSRGSGQLPPDLITRGIFPHLNYSHVTCHESRSRLDVVQWFNSRARWSGALSARGNMRFSGWLAEFVEHFANVIGNWHGLFRLPQTRCDLETGLEIEDASFGRDNNDSQLGDYQRHTTARSAWWPK